MFFVSIAIFLASNLQAAENYIGAHIHNNPEKVFQFIDHLPERDSLVWQAWLHLQLGNFVKANEIFYKLAKANDAQGYRGLADSYLAGQGCVKDIDLALVLYEKAASLGLGTAQVNAAVLRADKQEWQQSKIWFDLALKNPEMTHMKEELTALYHKRLDGHL